MTEKKLEAIVLLLVIAVMVSVTIWWLPQKWQGCQKIYENRQAQIICFLSK